MHIGSQINETQPFVEAIEKLTPLVRELRQRYGIEFFSIGGGIGIVYESSLASGGGEWWSKTKARPQLTIQDYVSATLPLLRELDLRIVLEPGRILVGNAGVLLTRVLYRKEAAGKKFVILDAGMNDLIRPALYQSYHEIVPVRSPAQRQARESSMSLVRFARVAIFSRSIASCRNCRLVISSR